MQCSLRAKLRLRSTTRPNHAMERTADRCKLHFCDDFHIPTPSDTRYRPPSLILFSLGLAMAIRAKPARLHWNYFLALESDVARVARFIEFQPANFGTFSIELGRILLAASSEVDVVAKLVCSQLEPKAK